MASGIRLRKSRLRQSDLWYRFAGDARILARAGLFGDDAGDIVEKFAGADNAIGRALGGAEQAIEKREGEYAVAAAPTSTASPTSVAPPAGQTTRNWSGRLTVTRNHSPLNPKRRYLQPETPAPATRNFRPLNPKLSPLPLETLT